MNPDHERFELIRRHIDGTATAEDLRALQEALRGDAAFRRQFARYANIDAALGSGRLASPPVPSPVLAFRSQTQPGWLAWRPLMAAAAGIVFGMLCTSMVFGFVMQLGVEKMTPVAVFEPGFEDSQMPLAKDFPDASARWGGNAAQVVAAENGVPPKEGKFMLRLEALAKGVPRIYQVLDLQSLPSGAGTETRDMEISASFAAADPEAAVRYVIRAFAVTEAPDTLDASWFDRREESISSAARGMDVTPGTAVWQTFSLRMQVPRAARSLVLYFGVRTPDKDARTSPHYLDDVRVSLLTPLPLP
jgi:hypothetical protein